jgi:hypothetical protein
LEGSNTLKLAAFRRGLRSGIKLEEATEEEGREEDTKEGRDEDTLKEEAGCASSC